jgi:transaldolase
LESLSPEEAYEMYRALLDSPRWLRIQNAGARSQRLLWASTGTKDPKASDILYVESLAFPFTVNTMPEATLKGLSLIMNSAKLYARITTKSSLNSP